MLTSIFKSVTNEEKVDAVAYLVEKSSPRNDFFLMVALSVSMASFGVILDSTIILIGSMLIAPVLYPILTLSLGLISADHKLISRSFYTILKSFAYAVVAGFVIGAFFGFKADLNKTIISIITAENSSFAYMVVAAISGLAASFATVKKSLNETLPGVAISVSIVPPLAVVGLGLSRFDWDIITRSFLLFLVNVAGVVFSAMIVFSLFKLSMKKTVVKEAVEEEDKKIEAEQVEEE